MTNAPPTLSPTSTLFPPPSPGSANVSCADEKADVSQDSQSDDDTQPTMAKDTLPTTRSQNTAKPKRRKKFGIKHASVNPQRGNDPFDYEQKYAEDETFKEMGPMARIWKVFLDECGRFDAEMAEDWRDALDVLLVFAGLFSAVVSAFVVQTCQDLKPNFMEINTHLMFESIAIERAKANGSSIADVPTSQLTPFTPFQASRADLWINGLWFTSLALSLTTALMAVLTKQWIHQYLSVPSGTPQDRCRIHQFRYMSLENWHVPVIIGLLPVLMHVALGVFLGGLVLYLCSFSKPMAGVIGSIAAGAFLVYTATNLLPIFKSDCPYKTPLTLHCYDLSLFAWPKIKAIFRFTWKVESPKEYKSLKAVEREKVKSNGGNTDVHCLSWLYNMSSNSSVQRVVMQALSNIPLAEAKAIHKVLPALASHIRSVLADYITPSRQSNYERLYRALNRFDDWNELSPEHEPLHPSPDSLCILFHDGRTQKAIDFLRREIVSPTVEFDVLTWVRILRNALYEGVAWLDVNDNSSPVWNALRAWFLEAHICHKQGHHRDEVWTVLISCDQNIGWKKAHRILHVLESNDMQEPRKTTSDGATLQVTIQTFLYPSLCHFLASNALGGLDIPLSLPGEIRLHLALLRCQSTLLTSTPCHPTTRVKAPLGKLIDNVRIYLDMEAEAGGWEGGALAHHRELPRAIYSTLLSIFDSDFFDEVRLRDQQDLLQPLIRTMVLDGKLREEHGTSWMSPKIIQRIIEISFIKPASFLAPAVSEILNYNLFCRSTLGLEMYAHLLDVDWVVTAEKESIEGPLTDPAEQTRFEYQYTYPFLISSYIDGLEFLKEGRPTLYQRSIEYISRPGNLLAMSKILVLGDVESRTRIWKLASLVERDVWLPVLQDLDVYLSSDDALARHTDQLKWLRGKHPFHLHVLLTWAEFEDLRGFVAQFRDAINCERIPLVTPVYNMPKQLEDFKIPDKPAPRRSKEDENNFRRLRALYTLMTSE